MDISVCKDAIERYKEIVTATILNIKSILAHLQTSDSKLIEEFDNIKKDVHNINQKLNLKLAKIENFSMLNTQQKYDLIQEIKDDSQECKKLTLSFTNIISKLYKNTDKINIINSLALELNV